eukprot:jgi/Astpho2/8914/gw1.00132.49.1_t
MPAPEMSRLPTEGRLCSCTLTEIQKVQRAGTRLSRPSQRPMSASRILAGEPAM